MADIIPKNIFIIGGTGMLGSQITQALLDKKIFNVKLLVRKDTFQSKKELLDRFAAAGATFVEGDTSNAQELGELMKGCDTVLSALGGDGLVSGEQRNILEAAKIGGLKRIIPSEFGFRIQDESSFISDNLFKEGDHRIRKIQLRNDIINSGLDYTFIFTSAFYEFALGPPTGFNIEQRQVKVPGDGNAEFCTTHTSDVAKYTAEILADPASRNQRVHVYGEKTTYNQAIKIFEEELGEKFQVVRCFYSVTREIQIPKSH